MVNSPWLSVDEASEYLKCGDRVLRELMSNKLIPHVIFAKKALFHPAKLDEWLMSQMVGELPSENNPKWKGAQTMIEADMERMVRDYPEEFFKESLKLISQQEAFPAGITDLIFEDRQGDLLVVELKKGILQRDHIAQIIDYLEDVEERYAGKNVELMVIANIVPSQRRTKLERLGVTFLEIPETKFREVAEKYDVSLAEKTNSPRLTNGRIAVSESCPKNEVATLVEELIQYGERFVTGLGIALKQELENSGYKWLTEKTYARLSRWCHPNRSSEREQWVIPRAHRISELLFGSVIDRTYHPSYGK